MVDFSGDPDRCRNVSRPDPAVRSSNTIGAPSTKPPAVMGRLRASLTGANTPAVLEPPVGEPGGCCAAWIAPATAHEGRRASSHGKIVGAAYARS